MQDRTKTHRMRRIVMQARRSRIQLGWMTKLSSQNWFRVSPIFFVGTLITAIGTTISKNDSVLFAGLLIMAVGVVAMWVAEVGKLNIKSLPGPLVFITGSVLTAMSMTINPSNPMLCAGMILTGLGTIAMWMVWVGELKASSVTVAVLFTIGITIEAISLTVVESDLMLLTGMIATGLGAFAMWAFELVLESDEADEKESTPE